MKAWTRTPGAIDPRRTPVEVSTSRRGDDLVLAIHWGAGKTVELGIPYEDVILQEQSDFWDLPESEEKSPAPTSDDIGDLLR